MAQSWGELVGNQPQPWGSIFFALRHESPGWPSFHGRPRFHTGNWRSFDRGSTSDTEISTIHHQNIMWYHMYVTPLSYPLVCTCSRFQNNWTWSNITLTQPWFSAAILQSPMRSCSHSQLNVTQLSSSSCSSEGNAGWSCHQNHGESHHPRSWKAPEGKKGERKGHPNPSPQIDLIGYIYIDRAPKIVFFLEDVCLPICKCPTLQSSIHHTTYFQAAVLNIISRKLPWRGYAAFRTNPEHSPAHEFLW